MTFLPGNLFHTGVVVADIDAAIAHFESLGLRRWTTVTISDTTQRTEAGDVHSPFRWSYSADGPHHIELIQPLAPSLTVAGVHHLGYWSDDFTRDGALLQANGFEPEYVNVSPDGTVRDARYFAKAGAGRIELVGESVRSMLQGRWADAITSSDRAV